MWSFVLNEQIDETKWKCRLFEKWMVFLTKNSKVPTLSKGHIREGVNVKYFLTKVRIWKQPWKVSKSITKKARKDKDKDSGQDKGSTYRHSPSHKNIPTYHYQAQARNIVLVMVFLIMSARGCISVSNSLQMNMNLNYKVYREYCEN